MVEIELKKYYDFFNKEGMHYGRRTGTDEISGKQAGMYGSSPAKCQKRT